MKLFKLLPLLLLFFMASCSSVQVATDYDSSVNFSQFKTYAFMKDGVDKINISDLDKKRILKAIDEELTAKGFTKSENPDLLINLFTDAKQIKVFEFFEISKMIEHQDSDNLAIRHFLYMNVSFHHSDWKICCEN